MEYTKPIYVIRKDTCVASDEIRPYGERIRIASEQRTKEVVLQLLGGAPRTENK